jgi:hypothetical protein
MATDRVGFEPTRAIQIHAEDHGRRLAGIHAELAALGWQVGGLTTAVCSSKT